MLVKPSTLASFYKNPEWVDVPIPAHKVEGRRVSIAVLLTDDTAQKFDPAQPRDARGRFAEAWDVAAQITKEFPGV